MPGDVGVLFVCLGNICRSPTAEAVFRARVVNAGLERSVRIDSAGTGAWHVGKSPDPRAQAAALMRGYDLSMVRARQVAPAADFPAFDFILAMDHDNLAVLQGMAPPSFRNRVGRLLDHAAHARVVDVPDPYYSGVDGFENVLDLIEDAADGLLARVRERLA